MSSKWTLEACFSYVFAVLMFIGMHYFQHNQGGSGLELPFNLVVWCFASLLIGLGLLKVSHSQRLRYNRSLLVMLFSTILLWLPLLYPNAEFGEFAIDRLLGLSAGILIIFSIMQLELSRQHWHHILYFILAGVLIESIYALVQLYLLTQGNWVGFNVNATRAAGIFQQPNVLGTFVLFGLLASAWLISEKAVRSKLQQIIVFGCCFFAAWAAIVSGSRTVLIALFALLPLLFPYLKNSAEPHLLRGWLICIALGCLAPALPELLNDGVARDAIGGETTAYRVTMLKVSWELFKQQPFMGWGYGAYDGIYHNAQAAFNAQGLIKGYHFNVAHPHNEIAYWAVEGGLLPLLTLLFLAGYFIYSIFKQTWTKACFHLGLLFPCLLHTMTELPFYHSAIVWLLFCFFVSKIATEAEGLCTKPFPAKFAPKVFAGLIPLFTILFMLTGLQTIHHISTFERTGSSDVSLLEGIINPLPMLSRYEFDAMTFRLNAASKLHLSDELKNYLSWSDSLMRRKTRTENYYNRIQAFKALGLTQQAEQTYQQALFIYPDTERVSFRYIFAMRTGEKALQAYLVWNKQQLKDKPDAALYIHQINGLVLLGRIDEALRVQQQASQRLPNELKLRNIPSLKPYTKPTGSS
ncbi:Wzy polymerase domain-containing protein [Agarivorans sp. Z349TD_8]|uniref:PglL family O-oligosaccharyltransferase n=1 Tax=Agarivorans sp. Z349TD_8 TaxID=3421434 RepID=UPI003D7CD17A